MKQTALFPSSSSHCVKLQNLPFCQPKPRRPPICKKLSGNGSSSSSTSQNQELLSSAQLPQFSSSEVTSRTGEDGLVGGQPWPVQPCRRILYAWRGGWAKHHSKLDGLTSTSLIPKKGHSRKGKVWPGRVATYFVFHFPDFQVPARGSPTRSLEDNPSLLATVSASATAYSAKPPAGPQGESLQQVSQRPRSTQTYLTNSFDVECSNATSKESQCWVTWPKLLLGLRIWIWLLSSYWMHHSCNAFLFHRYQRRLNTPFDSKKM